jgi:hypothetical protein
MGNLLRMALDRCEGKVKAAPLSKVDFSQMT